MRTIVRSEEFIEFYKTLPPEAQMKVKYILYSMEHIKGVSTKLIKKLLTTEFYEMRISVKNEYRVILFAIDNRNFVEATQIILLNGFMKKSTKDYRHAIQKARAILNKQRNNNDYED